jgi:poly(3-hydroxybutyrate) depolymerase
VGSAGTTSSGGTSAGSGGAGAGASGAAGTSASNYGNIPGLEDLSTVKPSAGCGTDITAAYPGIMNGQWQPVDNHDYMSGYQIAITSPAMHPVVPGKVLQRRYFIRLPPNYDKSHVYKMLYQGAGCTGKGTDVSPFDTVTKGTAIQIALEIYPGVWGGGSDTSGAGDPGVSCFDDKRGALSIEAPFIEALHERLKSQLCFDEHRVFIAGHSSGGWLANQFGASYGSKIFRAISPSSGGLAQGTLEQPPDGLPVPGIWWHQPLDGTNPFQGTVDGINHALIVNKCTPNFDTSPEAAAPFPNVSICQKFTSCPAQFPIIVCRVTAGGGDHRNNLDDPNQRAAAWSFFDAF